MSNNPQTTSIVGQQTASKYWLIRDYWQPLVAYLALICACLWGIVPSPVLSLIGHILGEHWYSLYNCMLAAAAALLFATSYKEKKPALAWRVWDIALCCAIMSLGGKLIPLDRPSGGPHGFPSGHTLTAFAASCLLLRLFPKVSPYAFMIAVAVGWSRVEIGEHYTYQVLFGGLFGIAVGLSVGNAKDNVGVLLPRLFQIRKK
jgi:membrane-associated phospholipid phosphatase